MQYFFNCIVFRQKKKTVKFDFRYINIFLRLQKKKKKQEIIPKMRKQNLLVCAL